MNQLDEYGIGLKPFDIRPKPAGLVEYTTWFAIFWIPIFPIRSYRGQYLGELAEVDLHAEHLILGAERIPHDWDSIFSTYLKTLVLLAVAAAPLAFLIWYTDNRAATPLELVAMFVVVIWPLLVIVVGNRLRKRILESSNDTWFVKPPPTAIAHKEVLGLLLCVGVSAIPSLLYHEHRDPFWTSWHILVGVALLGAIGGFLVSPRCRSAGLVAGLLAASGTLFASIQYSNWRPGADTDELAILMILVCLPALGIGYLITKRWGRPKGEARQVLDDVRAV